MKIRNSEGYMDVVAYKAIMNVDREKKAETIRRASQTE